MKYTLLILLTITLSQCNSKNDRTKDSDLKNDTGRIEIALSDSVFETVPINSNLTIYNFTNDTVKMGADYSIEYCSKNGWKSFPFKDDIGFDLVETSILPKQSYMMTLFFYPNTHTYHSGKYRIVKHYSIHKDEFASYFEFSLK